MEKANLHAATITALRQEIQNRSLAQHTLISLNLAAMAAIGSIALAQGGKRDILLLLPLFSPVVGALYLDHSRAIGRLGERVYELYAGNEDVIGLEGFRGPVSLLFSVPVGLVFILLPILALSVAIPGIGSVKHWSAWVLWGCGILCVVGFAILWKLVMLPTENQGRTF